MKYLTRHGNSWALVIDKPVLELLHLDPSTTPVEMRTNGKNLVIEPVNEARRDELVAEARKNSHQKFGRAYKRLAK
ncbi:MAG: AbrB/MazE/SpoVT family DNA-binding domain-containing protein [Chloroflexota bacterium]